MYPISRYLNVRASYAPSFFADGERLAFITNITGIPQVWQVDVADETRWPEQLTFEKDRVGSVWCSPTANRLIYDRDVGGNENMQLFLLDGATETLLTQGHEQAFHIFGAWAPEGEKIAYSANRRHRGLFDLYVQPLDGGEAQLVWENNDPGYLAVMDFSPDGERLAFVRAASSFENHLYELNLSNGQVRQLSPPDRQARYHSASYAADGRSLYVNTDLGADFMRIARFDLDDSRVEIVTEPAWDIEAMKASPNGRYLAYEVNVNGASEVQLLDVEAGETRVASAIGDAPGQAMMFSFSPDSSRVAFTFSSATSTYDVYIWDLASDAVWSVTKSGHGGLPIESFVAPELIHYPTFDEDDSGDVRRIPAWLYRSSHVAGQPVPAIIMVHGGPEAQYRPFFSFLIQYFVQHGYAVLAPNVRGSTGYGKAYSYLDDVEKRMDSVQDLAFAAHWLKTQPDIDGDKIVVYGGSYGGFMVLAALTTYPELWSAGVDIVGISSFVTFLENTSDYRRAHREAEYGSLERDREFMESIAPLNHLHRITAPLMVIHGANDPRVPLGEAEQVVNALRNREVPVEFLVFDDEGHGLVKLENKQVAYPAIVEFLEKHLS